MSKNYVVFCKRKCYRNSTGFFILKAEKALV